MLKQLIDEMAEIDARANAIKQEKVECQTRIDAAIDETVRQARDIQGKDTGTVNVLIDGIEVKHTISKKVLWDQEILFDVFQKIYSSGDKPGDYMKMSFSVPEKLYDGFQPAIKAHFSPARTVQAGTIKTEFKEVTP